MLSIIYLVLILSLIIFVHEFGHFVAAKMCGVYVSEFALGMGPKIFSFKRKNKNDPTEYSLRLFPIGGFCAMAGEVDEDMKGIKKNQFMCNKSKWQRFLILIAGVTMNIILAIVILFFQALIWGTTEQRSVVGYAPEGYPISEAGIEVGDKVIGLNGYRVNTWDKLTLVLNLKNESGVYNFKVKKADGTIKEYSITPKVETDEDGNETKVFGIGVGDKVYKGVFNALKYAFVKLGTTISGMIMIIASLFTGKLGLASLSGPVGMYTIVGESAKVGFQNIVYLTAYLSVNVAVINAIPFPAFDGGRILFIIIEAIKGSKVSPKVEGIMHTIGFALLMLLMLYITIQDIIRLF